MATKYEIWKGKTMVTVTADLKAAEEYVHGANSTHPEVMKDFAGSNARKNSREHPGHPGLVIKEVKA